MVPISVKVIVGKEREGELNYVVGDYAFDFQPADLFDPGTLLFASVSLNIDSAGVCHYAWGYSPFQGWQQGSLEHLPMFTAGRCVVDGGVDPGDVVTIVRAAEARTIYERATGRVLIESIHRTQHAWGCHISPGLVLLAGDDGQLTGLLLQPSNREEVSQAVS